MPTQGLLVNVERRDIYAAIEAERARQCELGFTAAHDDAVSCPEWIAILARHVGLAADDGSHAYDLARVARQMVRIAAVATAVLEVLKRAGVEIPREPDPPPPEKVAGPTVEQRGSQIG